VGLLRTYEGPSHDSRLRLRSGRSSYADLQQLRATNDTSENCSTVDRTFAASALADAGGTHFHVNRHSPRQRRASLSKGVAVERIAGVDQRETFQEATEDINREDESAIES